MVYQQAGALLAQLQVRHSSRGPRKCEVCEAWRRQVHTYMETNSDVCKQVSTYVDVWRDEAIVEAKEKCGLFVCQPAMSLSTENPTNVPGLEGETTELLGPGSPLPQPVVVAGCTSPELFDPPAHLCPSFLATRRMGEGVPELAHPCFHKSGSPRKVSLETESVSLYRLYAALNIKLNPAFPAGATLQKPLTICKFGDMTRQFLHCQQFRPDLIGTNYLQVCPWATGLLMGQLLGLPTYKRG